MKSRLRFNKIYFILSLLLLLTEIIIAIFIHDQFVRPIIGDFLVVILIYCFIKSFLNLSVIKTAIFVLLFSYVVEILQYFNTVEKLGLQNNNLASIIIGNAFSWIDIIAYTSGIVIIILIEITIVSYAKFKIK